MKTILGIAICRPAFRHVIPVLLLLIGFASGCGPAPSRTESEPPLIAAVRAGNLAAVKRLVSQDKVAFKQEDSNGNNAAHLAILDGREAIFYALIDAGYPVDDPRLLLCCCSRGTPESARILEFVLRRGVSPNQIVGEGSTSLNLAVNNGFESLAELLLKHGANPRMLDTSGKDAFATLDANLAFIKDPHSIWRREAGPSDREVAAAIARCEAMKARLHAVRP